MKNFDRFKENLTVEDAAYYLERACESDLICDFCPLDKVREEKEADAEWCEGTCDEMFGEGTCSEKLKNWFNLEEDEKTISQIEIEGGSKENLYSHFCRRMDNAEILLMDLRAIAKLLKESKG